MSLPQFQSNDRDFQLMQSAWATQLNPVLSNVFLNGQLLQSVSLATGLNNINHKLGRKLQGWAITRLRAASTVYDQQDTNITPSTTLILNSSAPVVVDLWVF